MSIQIKHSKTQIKKFKNFSINRIYNHIMLDFLALLRNHYGFVFKPEYIFPNLVYWVFVFVFFLSKQLLFILTHNTKYTLQSSAQPTINWLGLLKRDLQIVFHAFGLSPDLIQAGVNHEDRERLLHAFHAVCMSPWLWKDGQSSCMACGF